MKLRKFDKRKSLNHLKNKRNNEENTRIVTCIISILIIVFGIIYFTFAKFESRSNEFILIDSRVGDFSNSFKIVYHYNGEFSVPPAKEDNYTVENITCINASITWDIDEWKIVEQEVNDDARCDIYFKQETTYYDKTIATTPKLYKGLIPVTFDSSGTIKVANPNNEWYNYANQEWANAVLVDNPSDYLDSSNNLKASTYNQEINIDHIMQMYVWLPRYRYKLFNAENSGSTEQMIDVKFESAGTSKSNGSLNNEWLTHPAFTFGETELEGIWVGKFDPSSTSITSGAGSDLNCSSENCSEAQTIRIKPDVDTLRNQSLAGMYYLSRSIENISTYGIDSTQIDTHMMKNIEWGATAYLSYSKYGIYNSEGTCKITGCKIYNNSYYNNSTRLTGCCTRSADDSNETYCWKWNSSSNNGKSSTTGNVYGIYDMVGGIYKYVMGNVSIYNPYEYESAKSSLSTMPNQKYIDTYINTEKSGSAHQNGKLGDATREIIKTLNSTQSGWYTDYVYFPSYTRTGSILTSAWFIRGNAPGTGSIFSYSASHGSADSGTSFRIVLTEE